MRITPVLCAVLFSAVSLSSISSAQAQAFSNMSAADARAAADKSAANHAAAVRAAEARAASARAAALAPPPTVKLPDSKTPNQLSAHAKAFSNMSAAEARAAADKSAAIHAAAARAAAARAAALIPPPPIKLPEFKTPAQLFTYSRHLSDPESAGVPFHMKTSFVASGNAEFTGNGTYEEWWQSKDVWRKEATLGNYKYVAIQNGASQVAAATSVYTPLRVWQAMNLQLFQLGQTESKQPKWVLTPITRNGAHWEQVQQPRPCSLEEDSPACLDQYIFSTNGALQSYSENDLLQSYSHPQPFLALQIPRKITLALQENPLLAIQILSLVPLAPKDRDLFNLASLPSGSVTPAKVFTGEIPDRVVLPQVIQRAPMQFPKHGPLRSSTVVIECRIDANGTPREPFVKISGGPAYDRQALKSLRQWKFAPGTLDGQPIIVKTVVVMDFVFKPTKHPA